VFHGTVTEGQLVAIRGEIEDELQPEDSIYLFTAEVAGTVECTAFGDAEEPGSKFTWLAVDPPGLTQNSGSTAISTGKPKIAALHPSIEAWFQQDLCEVEAPL
jgi:hypothetical protein